jgi:hypothetical protein
MKTSTQEQEAEKFLAAVDSELARVSAEATVDLDQTAATVAKHEAALEDGSGLLASVEAKNFLRAFDEHLFPGMVTLGKTSNQNRIIYFRGERPRLEFQAKENYIREHAAKLSAALEKLISARSKNREASRNRIADEYLALERRRLLDGYQTLTPSESRRLVELEEILVASDSVFYEATRLAARMKTAPNLETYNDARRFAASLNFDA